MRLGRLPLRRTSEPYSLIARAKDRAAPAAAAGAIAGRITRRKVVKRLAPRDGSSLLDVEVELLEHRLHRADDEREGDEGERQEHRPAGAGDVDPDRALRPVEREQHQAGDDRRQREGDVDDDVDQAAAPEAVPDERPGDSGAHEDVDDGHQRRLHHGEAQR